VPAVIRQTQAKGGPQLVFLRAYKSERYQPYEQGTSKTQSRCAFQRKINPASTIASPDKSDAQKLQKIPTLVTRLLCMLCGSPPSCGGGSFHYTKPRKAPVLLRQYNPNTGSGRPKPVMAGLNRP
jgi:hypothetical protein